MARFRVLLIFCSLFFTALITQGREILEAGQVFWDGDILQSPGKLFQLKFFTPEFSKSSYLGIQKQGNIGETETGFIWVANRDKPLIDHSGVLNLTSDGFLMIYHDGGSILLNPEHKAVDSVGNFTLGILDSGNLVLRKKDVIWQSFDYPTIWQSFDYPTDSLLPGMKLGLFDLKSEKPRQQSLVSWLSPFVPASGAFTLGVDPNNTEQLVIWRRGRVYWQGRDLNNTMEILSFTISPYAYLFDYVSNENESYFTLSRDQGIRFAWISMNSSGTINRFVEMEQLIPGSAAMTYGPLYAKGYSQFDLCDRKYKYRSSPNDDYCVMVNSANCSNGDKFVHRFGYLDVWTVIIYNSSLSISDCGEICRSNCSCTAYATSLLNGTGCMLSTSENFKRTEDGKDSFFYIRKRVMDRALRRSLWQFIVFPVIALIFLALIISCGIWVLRGKNGNQKNKPKLAIEETTRSNKIGSGEKDHDLPLFKFSTVESATGNFSIENKLGQGGFGPVYKGKLENGQEIAVKRLCRSSGQGIEEFENEVILISKLQHRNLVKLLGFCTQVDEKLLIYEYLPNKSLDSFLFDSTKRLALDWRKRFCIIEGIAQGLLYLHKYSRLRIIHRDLKTSNILLDRDLNPKISDFGLARAFGEDESRANTMNIAGTRGYMSPEYAMGGLISVKSDVFSYGVMILEIISGKKNASFLYENRFLNLLGYAWDLWKEERALELMDPGLLEEHSLPIEVARCVQIGLLCVQENAADRPTMSEVMLFLNNEMLILPVPKKPAFFTVVTTSEEEEKTEQVWPCSVNEVTISNVSGR